MVGEVPTGALVAELEQGEREGDSLPHYEVTPTYPGPDLAKPDGGIEAGNSSRTTARKLDRS